MEGFQLTDDTPVRLVILDDAYSHWGSAEVRSFLGHLLLLRFQEYGLTYGKCLPAGNTDWFSTHIATCVEIRGQWIPVSAYQMTTRLLCRQNNVSFPPQLLAQQSEQVGLVQWVEKDLARCELINEQIGYCGYWSISREARKNLRLAGMIRDLVYCSHYFWQQSVGIRSMYVAGVPLLKTDLFQKTIGYEPILLDGKVSSSFSYSGINGEKITLMKMQKPTLHCETVAEHLRSYWDNRIVLSSKDTMSNLVEDQDFEKAA